MKKYIALILSLFFFFPIIVLAEDFDITGENVILYNLNDNMVLYEKNANDKTSIASLTKMMTAMTAIDIIDDLNKEIVIKKEDFYGTEGYSEAGFKVGDKVTYLDLLYGILLPSGADAVNAIVNNTLGNSKFIEKMNENAKKIGLKNTSFSNAIGKDNEANYSTAKDMATLVRYAIKNETFLKIFTTKEYITTNGLKLKSTLNHYSDLLNVTEIKGAKSGFTKGAGRCLASIATLNDVDYLLVVINASKEKPYNAVKDSLTIYDYYKDNYSYQQVIDKDEVITSIPIKWSKEDTYNITALEDIDMYLKNGVSDDLTYKYEGVEEIKKGTKKDTYLGVLKVFNGNEPLTTQDVYLEENIKYYEPMLIIGLIILVLLIIIKLLTKRKRKKRGKR